jgi:Ca-activated chloride channel family protein
MKRNLLWLGCIFAITLWGAPFSTLPAQKAQEERVPVFRTEVEVVNVLCTVRKGSRYVSDLSREDFEVFEDDVKQEIRYFSFESDEDAEPLNVVLLVDTSGSVKDKLRFEQEAANVFLAETLRKNKDLAAVVQFDSDINLVQDFTYDLKILEHSIEDIRAGGATKLYDAIWVAVDELLQHEVGRKILVVLSDGADTQSVMKEEDAIRIAQERDVMIFGIGVRGGRMRSDFGTLKKFAERTGGRFYNSKVKLSELQKAFAAINQAIKNQYNIGYVSTNPVQDHSFRKIKVKAKARGLKVSHRRGYYAGGTGS